MSEVKLNLEISKVNANIVESSPLSIVLDGAEPSNIILELSNTVLARGAADGGTGFPALSMPTGFSVSGSNTANLAVSYASEYSLPTNTRQGEWDTAFADRLKWDGGSTGLNASTGRTSLQLGGAATLNVGATAGTVAAGDDERFATAASDIAAILIRLGKLQYENCIYVALSGNDLSGTGAVDSPLRTVRAAALIAQPGDVVFIAPGTYVEATLPIRWKYDVTVFGAGLRSTIIQPAAGQEFNDIFKVDSGFWCWGVSFAGHQADETRQAWAIDFDELADNTARGAVGLGAFVLKSPYIQNCTSITAEDDAGTAGSQSIGNTGGGIRVDGEKCAKNSPIRSMVVDSYTQVNLGGPGCLVLNDGYAQLVSFFGTFCTYHVRTETGGQVNLSGGGTTDFGIYGLMADGYSRTPLFTGSARVAAYGAVRLQKAVTIDVETDLFGCTGHELSAGDQVVINATQGVLPTGISASTVYFVIASGLTADAFKLSTAAGGSSLDMSGSASGTYEFVRQGVTQLDVVGFSANRLGRQIKYPTAGSLGSPGSPVQITARGGSAPGSTFTVTLGTSTIGHEYVGGGVVTVGGTDYAITSAVYNGSTGVTVLTATGYAPTVGASITLAGLSFICDSASRPNAGQIMFPQLVFPRNASTEAPEAKTFAYTRTGDFTLTYTEAASPAGPEHEYVSGGTVVIGGTDYGVANAVYNKATGLVTLTTKLQLPAGNGNVTVEGLRFICPTSAYVVTSSVPIDASGTEVANTDPTRAGYRVVFFSGLNGGLKDPISQGQVLDFRNRSQISAPSHTFEFVGSGTNYDALPWNGGVPVEANAIAETNNGRVYSSNTNEKGDFKVGTQFSVDGTSGSVTINTDQFNLSGLNFIGPFSRNGGISTVGEQLRELSNNTSLIASTGTPDGNTATTQFAVKTYADNRFLQDVTVTAGLPLTVTDTSTQDGQGYWTRRRNLSLSVGTTAGTVAAGDDSRLSDARPPTAHKSSHAVGGADALTPGDIGAATSAQGGLADSAVQPGDLATVATSGAYADLIEPPTIPAAADAAPQPLGATAAIGDSTDYARENHVHQRDTDLLVVNLSGNEFDPTPSNGVETFTFQWPAQILASALSADTAASGSAFEVNARLNASSIYSVRPQIAVGSTTGSSGTLTITTAAAGDVLRFDISQAGGGCRLAKLYLTVRRTSA